MGKWHRSTVVYQEFFGRVKQGYFWGKGSKCLVERAEKKGIWGGNAIVRGFT
jgi:hypothetical protein